MSNKVRVAAVQAAPIIMDEKATVEKAVKLIKEAADAGAKLVVFPEAFISCYPRGLSFGFIVGSRTDAGREDFKRYYDSSVLVPSETTEILANAALELSLIHI